MSVLLNAGGGTLSTANVVSWKDNNSVVVADVNGDGKPDLIAAEYYNSKIKVFLGNGDGTFQPPSEYLTGSSPFWIVTGDFNNDGHTDLIVQCGVALHLFFGRGDGTFGPAIVLPFNAPGQVAAADFNRDGKLDLALTNAYTSNTVSIYLGNGNGTFTAAGSFPTGTHPEWLAVADFNHDGIPDLAITDFGVFYNRRSGDVAVLLGKGDGSFQPAVFYNAGTNPGPLSIADFGGAGNPGVVVADSSFGAVYVLYGNGDGTLQPAGTSYGVYAQTLAAGDLNGDGKADLLFGEIGCCAENLLTMLNDGNGSFAGPATYYPTTIAPYYSVLGDFNGDGKVDVVVAGPGPSGSDGTAAVFLGNGDGTFPATEKDSFDTGGQGPASMLAGDLNRDGKLDLAIGNIYSSNVSVFLGKGDGTFNSPVSYASGTGIAVLGDFNGDGILDIASIGNGSSLGSYSVDMLLGNGDGTFRTGPSLPLYYSPFTIAAADLNRDGKLDLVLSAGFGFALVALGNGDGSFQPAVPYSLPGYIANAVLGDFNGDGIVDLGFGAVHAYCDYGRTGSVGYMPGRGDGTFGAPIITTSSLACPGLFVTAGDLNADGRTDLIEMNGPVMLFLAQATGLEAQENYVAGLPISAVIGDLNGDGAPDIVAPGGNGFTVLMNASGVKVGLTSSPNPSKKGQAVTFTASVAGSFSALGTPTGTVTFSDRSKLLGTVTLANGTAPLTTSSLSVGTHSITASYGGDSNFVPVTSAVLSQTVNQ